MSIVLQIHFSAILIFEVMANILLEHFQRGIRPFHSSFVEKNSNYTKMHVGLMSWNVTHKSHNHSQFGSKYSNKSQANRLAIWVSMCRRFFDKPICKSCSCISVFFNRLLRVFYNQKMQTLGNMWKIQLADYSNFWFLYLIHDAQINIISNSKHIAKMFAHNTIQ